MRKLVLAASLAAMAATSTAANAADMDREIGLIVSGVVDQWAGLQIIDNGLTSLGGTDTILANGGEGRLSLPLGDKLSIQMDAKYEYNSYALEDQRDNDVFGPRFSFQGASHLSWRDPSSFLIGVFGGMGTAAQTFVRTEVNFVGGEAQFYLDNLTFYVQGGAVDFDTGSGNAGLSLSDGLFARGAVRWFMDNGNRLEIEGTFLNVDYADTQLGEIEAFSVGARYDFDLNLPIAGEVPLFVGWRGTFRDRCYPDIGGVGFDLDDHTFMIGTSYSFSGDRITVDRQGATLDTPDFNYSCQPLT